MSGTLIAPVNSGKVPYEKLGEIPVPEATGRWKRIAHLELVDTLKNQINCNYRIAREEYDAQTAALARRLRSGTLTTILPIFAQCPLKNWPSSTHKDWPSDCGHCS